MKYIYFKKSVMCSPINSAFTMHNFNAGEEYCLGYTGDYVPDTYGKIQVDLHGCTYKFHQDDIEILDKEQVCLFLRLWYDGVETNNLYPHLSIPDIREQGYDINVPHEFKLISKIM